MHAYCCVSAVYCIFHMYRGILSYASSQYVFITGNLPLSSNLRLCVLISLPYTHAVCRPPHGEYGRTFGFGHMSFFGKILTRHRSDCKKDMCLNVRPCAEPGCMLYMYHTSVCHLYLFICANDMQPHKDSTRT